MKKPETIEIASETETVDSIKQYYYKVAANEKRKQLDRLILVENPESCIIFCNTRFQVDKVNEFLQRRGYASDALHGAISQSKRLRTINQFKKGDFHFLVATDVASRGIHVNDISHVINYDIPIEKDSYVHRIGRTGRAGNGGHAITLATAEDIMSLYDIEEHINAMIEERDIPSDEVVNENRKATEKALKSHSRPKPHGHGNKHTTTHERKKSASKGQRSDRPKSHTHNKSHAKSSSVKSETKSNKQVSQHKSKPQHKQTDVVKQQGVQSVKKTQVPPKTAAPRVQSSTNKKVIKNEKNGVTTIVLGNKVANDNRKWVPKKESFVERVTKRLFGKKS